MAQRPEHDRQLFLPDLCGPRGVFGVLVFAELFAIILSLASRHVGLDLWGDLGMTSLYMLWLALSCAIALCLLRRPLGRMSPSAAGIIAYLTLLLLVLLFSELGYRLLAGELGIWQGLDRGEFLMRNLALGAIVIGLSLRYFYVVQQWRHQVEAEAQARIEALQARIRPHFLFNSMNTIASLIRSRPEVAEEAVEDLSDLFRSSIGDGRALVPLDEELALTRRYLHLEQLRLGERLQLEWQVEQPSGSLKLPPLTLQPLVENAIYHGIEPLAEGGVIRISAEREGDRLLLRVINPLADTAPSHPQGNRMALENIRERLAVHFGGRASLNCESRDGLYRVTLRLPCEEAE